MRSPAWGSGDGGRGGVGTAPLTVASVKKTKGVDKNRVLKVGGGRTAHPGADDTVICLISNRRKSPILKSTTVYKLSQEKTEASEDSSLRQNKVGSLHRIIISHYRLCPPTVWKSFSPKKEGRKESWGSQEGSERSLGCRDRWCVS